MRAYITFAAVLVGVAVGLGIDHPNATGSSLGGVPGRRGTLWVANRVTNSVAVFDVVRGKAIAIVPVGRQPNSVVVVPQAQKAYVTDEGSNQVSVISLMTREVASRIAVESRPHHIRASKDGRRVYVSEFGTNKIAVIDTTADRVVAEYTTHPSDAARNHSSWITDDGRTLLLVNEGANAITALNAATGALGFTLPVGNRPSEVIASRNGKRAWVSIRGGENKLKAIDVARGRVTGEVTLPNQPDTLQLTPNERFLMVALRGSPAQLSVVDVRNLTVVTTIDLAGAGTVAGHNWLSADGRYSFVTYEDVFSPGIAVVDHRTQRVVDRWSYPGEGSPHGVFYNDPAATDGPVMTLSREPVPVRRSGIARLTLSCAAQSVGFCTGTLRLALGAESRFSLRPAQTRSVSVRLSKPARNRLHRARRLRVRTVATAQDQLGNVRRTEQMITFVAARL